MMKNDLPSPKFHGHPPEDLVEIVGKQFPEAWDRGWYKLIGHAAKSMIFQHACRGDYLTLVLQIYNAKLPWKVARCTKCECFYFMGPV